MNYKKREWQDFLKVALPSLKDRDALEEFMGYALFSGNRQERFLLLNGNAETIGAVVEGFMKLFKSQFSSVDARTFKHFGFDYLFGKRVNIGALNTPLDSTEIKGIHSAYSRNDLKVNVKHEKPYTIPSEDKPKLIFIGERSSLVGTTIERDAMELTFKKVCDPLPSFLDWRFKLGHASDVNILRSIANDGLKRLKKNKKFSV